MSDLNITSVRRNTISFEEVNIYTNEIRDPDGNLSFRSSMDLKIGLVVSHKKKKVHNGFVFITTEYYDIDEAEIKDLPETKTMCLELDDLDKIATFIEAAKKQFLNAD